ncbi:MAG: MarR family transcriptional regulator [Halobacteria archaeon]
MFQCIEFEVLAIINGNDTISELAVKLDRSESYISRAVQNLVEKGLAHTERDGRRKRVVPSDSRAVEIYQDLVRQHPHIEFPELLTNKALEVLYHLDQPRTVADIADRSDNYRNTVNRILKRFREHGLVRTDDYRYDFNADFDRLHDFSRELVHHLHRQKLESVAPRGTIFWEDRDEFIAQTETGIDVDGFHDTGIARFAAFGLQFFLTSYRYYLYSEERGGVSPAELCCHTLLIDDDIRHRMYCLLLLSHVNVDEGDLREHAAKYDLENVIDALLQYLETGGEVEDEMLPEWSEFQELAAEYEVALPQ